MIGKPRNRGGRYTPPRRVAVLTTEIPDDAPPALREGLARRRLVATTGRCPCGAVLELPDLVPGAVLTAAVAHEPDCPATDDAIAQAVAGWLP
jgi:hypothetical protein